jgi:hypothetical protein
LALAEIYAGGSRSDAARIGGVGLQLRDWVVRFNAEGPRGPLNGKAPGTPNIVDDSQRQALRHIVEGGPDAAVSGSRRQFYRRKTLGMKEFSEDRLYLDDLHIGQRFKNGDRLWLAFTGQPCRLPGGARHERPRFCNDRLCDEPARRPLRD